MSLHALCCAVLIVLLAGPAARAETVTVPGTFPTIQDAIAEGRAAVLRAVSETARTRG